MILIHYGEIFTKGLNRSFFQRQLETNLRRAVPGAKIRLEAHRFLMDAPRGAMDAVAKTFGVTSYAFAEEVAPEFGKIEEAALRVAKKTEGPLKVRVNRSDKKFPGNSTDIGKSLAQALEKDGIALSVKEPKNVLEVEIIPRRALVYAEKKKGPGGLPVGVSGKVVTLLSGGIDSPVASYLLAKRGIKNVYLHFHPFKPGQEKTEKIENLVRQLYPYTRAGRLYLVPYMPFTLASLSIDEDLILPIFRRFMMRVAERIAAQEGAKGIGSGENLSQVASQTLENLGSIEEAVPDLPILRPVLTYDKQDIIEVAKKIGTYDLSLRTYNDCCQSLVSEHPATRTTASQLKPFEARFPADLLEKTMQATKVIQVSEKSFEKKSE